MAHRSRLRTALTAGLKIAAGLFDHAESHDRFCMVVLFVFYRFALSSPQNGRWPEGEVHRLRLPDDLQQRRTKADRFHYEIRTFF